MKKYGVWEQPKDGSGNGCWSSCPSSGSLWRFDTLEEAQKKANAWNACLPYAHLHHEVRELPEHLWQS